MDKPVAQWRVIYTFLDDKKTEEGVFIVFQYPGEADLPEEELIKELKISLGIDDEYEPEMFGYKIKSITKEDI